MVGWPEAVLVRDEDGGTLKGDGPDGTVDALMVLLPGLAEVDTAPAPVLEPRPDVVFGSG